LSANLKTILIVGGLVSACLLPSDAMAQQKNVSPAESMNEILDRLVKIEKDQVTILENQQKILDELKNLRVWVRRS